MSETVNLTIDGKPVSVPKGSTILQAAKKLGIYIPTFCWHEKMSPIGACRICLVEVEKMPKPQVACYIQAAEGMAVQTRSEAALKAQRGVMEFLLINHPLDCPTCDKGGECDLQDIAYYVGNDKSRYEEQKRRFLTHLGSTFDERPIGPLVYLTMNRCIACFKCVRFLEEIAGEHDLGAFNRAGYTEISTLIDQPITNEFSGNTIEICPVGALTSEPFRYRVRVWLTSRTPSICSYCADGCNLTLWAKDGILHRATSRRNDLVDEGFICDKGRFGSHYVNHGERIKKPLIRKEGKLTVSSWEEAYNYIAGKLKDLKAKYGPDAFAGIASPRLSNEDNYLFQKFFRVVIGTNNIDHRVHTKNYLPSPDLESYRTLYTMSNSIEELEKTKLILVLGSDIAAEHPIIRLRIQKAVRRFKTSLIVAGTRQTRLKDYAGLSLVYKYGTEIAFLNGLCNIILKERLVDFTRLSLDASQLEELYSWVREFTPERVENITAISAEKLKQIAQMLCSRESCIFLAGREIIFHPQGEQVLEALHNLAFLTGHWGKSGSGVNVLWEYNNSQGALDMGVLPDRLPGFVKLNDNKREKFEKVWKARVPENEGCNVLQILDKINSGQIKVLYIMGENPIVNFPDKKAVVEALEKLEFLVVQEIFLTPTAEMADVVLPAASFAEKEGTFTSAERRIQKFQRAFKPYAESKPDWQIISTLAGKMGYDFTYFTAADINKEISSLVPFYSAVNFKTLSPFGQQWSTGNSAGPTRTYHDPKDLTQGGKVSFKKVEFQAPQPKDGYPYFLSSGNSVYHSASLSSWSEQLRKVAPEAYCEINPADAYNLKVKEGDWVELESARGKIKLKAKVNEMVQQGVVFVPINFPEAEINSIMDKNSKVDWVKLKQL